MMSSAVTVKRPYGAAKLTLHIQRELEHQILSLYAMRATEINRMDIKKPPLTNKTPRTAALSNKLDHKHSTHPCLLTSRG